MIWLAGNRGMLGTEVEELFARAGETVIASDREVDITRPGSIAAFLDRHGSPRLAWIVNCAAYTAVDAAEDDAERAMAVNGTGVAHLAAAAAAAGARLLHVSTDYVFDGRGGAPCAEDDPPNPLGVYGRTKLAGEEAARAASARNVTVRTSWLYGRHGPSFVATMLRLFRERDEVGVVDDQHGCPTHARDLAAVLVEIARRPEVPGGTYHFCNDGPTTWYGFACEILRQARARGLVPREVRVVPLRTDQYPTRARRPARAVLSTARLRVVLGIVPRPWEAALADYFEEGA